MNIQRYIITLIKSFIRNNRKIKRNKLMSGDYEVLRSAERKNERKTGKIFVNL